MTYDYEYLKKFRSDESFDEKIKNEIYKEIANTLGNYGDIIDKAVKNQNELLCEIKKLVFVNNKNRINLKQLEKLDEKEKIKVYKLIDTYNKNYYIAEKYQYYMNVQKEALNFRGFNYDPYNILPKLIIDGS